jgi:hypothetical protein
MTSLKPGESSVHIVFFYERYFLCTLPFCGSIRMDLPNSPMGRQGPLLPFIQLIAIFCL